jgi:hypothetical protein
LILGRVLVGGDIKQPPGVLGDRPVVLVERARAGAAGVGGSGSAGAVLRGLVEDAATDEQQRAAASSRQISEIRRSASLQRRNNLLDLAGGVGTSAASLLGRSSGQLVSLLDR